MLSPGIAKWSLRFPHLVGYKLVDASGDVALEASGPDLGALLVEFGRGVAHVLTEGSPVAARQHRTFERRFEGADRVRLAVGFVNEVLFLFEGEDFLVAGGRLTCRETPEGFHVTGDLDGEAFDSARHRHGAAVKAATFHGARIDAKRSSVRGYLMLDL